MSKLTSIAVPLLAICLPLSASYPIRMGRLDPVGLVLNIQAEGKQSLAGKATVGGKPFPLPMPETVTIISLNYQEEVIAANEAQKATKLKLTLGKSQCQFNGAPLALPPEGTVIEVRRENDKKVFLQDGFPLPEPVQNALGIVVELGDGRDEEDLQFGTSTPKEVGESWGVNSESILNIAGREAGIVGDPKKVLGKSKLEAVQKDEGVDCMKIDTHVEIRDVKSVFFLDKDSGLKFKNATVVIDQTSLLPVNPELQPHAFQGQLRLDALCTAELQENGAILPIDVEMKMEESIKLKLVEASKPAPKVDSGRKL